MTAAPLHPGRDLADLVTDLDPAEIHGAADRLRSIARLPAPAPADQRTRARLTTWADALDLAADRDETHGMKHG